MDKQPTIRERVDKVLKTLGEGALTPDMARESLVTLTGFRDTCASDFTNADLAYKPVLLAAREQGLAANQARMKAECSDEYAAMRKAQDTLRSVEQSIITCRAYLRSLDEEMRLSR